MKSTDLFYAMGVKVSVSKMVDMVLGPFSRKFLKGYMSQYRICYNEACSLQKDIDLVTYQTQKYGMGWIHLQDG